MPFDQRLRLHQRPVRDHHFARPRRQQRPQHAGRGAAGADQQHAFAGQRQTRVALDVIHQPSTVRVVGQPVLRILRIKPQHVRGLRQRGARGETPAFAEGIELEWHGDTAALCPTRHQRPQRLGESAQWPTHAAEFHCLPGLARKLGVDEGRLAVLDRVAGDDVKVHGVNFAAAP